DPSVPADLRARAFYLAGNLEFLRRKYEEAVLHYDKALAIIPGLYEEAGGDGIGRDASWNRAIALRRIQDQRDAGNDASDDASNDAPDGNDGDDGSDGADGNDGAPDSGEDGGDNDKPDSGDNKPDSGGSDGGQGDAGGDASPDQQGQDGGQPE